MAKGRGKAKVRPPKASIFKTSGLKTQGDVAKDRAKIKGEGNKGFLAELGRQNEIRPKYKEIKQRAEERPRYTGQDIVERQKEIPCPKLMNEDPSKAEKDSPDKGFAGEMHWNSVPKGQ